MKNLFITFIISCYAIVVTAQNNEFTGIDNNVIDSTMQSVMPIVREKDNTLVLMFKQKEWTVKKGDTILINLPKAGASDYLFVKKKKGFFNMETIGTLASIAGAGAMAVGTISYDTSPEVLLAAIKVAQKASAVEYGVNALSRIDELNISKKAKKIAGKKAIVKDWIQGDEGLLLNVTIDKKKYDVDFMNAILMNEIIIK